MEKKTIGGLIATLRKANGMTQKDLAEQLHVSDKTVSRWERDEGTPDLALIPVIAELFGVTCDELLRGERRSPTERAAVPDAPQAPDPKAEKQRQRLLNATLAQYQRNSYVAVGISVAALLVALICNLAFLRAVLGFLLGAIGFAASVLCQMLFLNKSLLSVEDAELSEDALARFRNRVFGITKTSFAVTVGLFGFTFPLVWMDTYVGMAADSMLLYGALSAAAFEAVYGVVCYFVNAAALRRGFWVPDESEAARFQHNHRLQRRCALTLASLLGVTMLAHALCTELWGPYSVANGQVFTDYESFVAYMELPLPAQIYGPAAPLAEELIDDSSGAVWYDEFGNEITEEQARHRTLEDRNGVVVCEYTEWNEQVVSMRYSPKDGTVLPITVLTQADVDAARKVIAWRNVLFCVAYAAEVLGVLGWYFIRRKR